MKKSNIVWGIICLAAAALIILTVTGVLSFSIFEGISTAKFVWTIILGIIFIKSLIDLSFEGMIISGGILFKMYSEMFGIEIGTFALIAVMILLIIAFNLIVPESIRHHHGWNGSCHNGNNLPMSVNEENGEYIYVKNRFNGMTKYINSKNFKEAHVDTAFGGFEMYFNDAQVPEGTAVVEVNARFSGVEIYIPRNWIVHNNMRNSMGGVEEMPIMLEPGEVAPVELNLCGSSSFSGIEIKRV